MTEPIITDLTVDDRAATEPGSGDICDLLTALALSDPIPVWAGNDGVIDDATMQLAAQHSQVVELLLLHPAVDAHVDGPEALGRLLGVARQIETWFRETPAPRARAEEAALAALIAERGRTEIIGPLSELEALCR